MEIWANYKYCRSIGLPSQELSPECSGASWETFRLGISTNRTPGMGTCSEHWLLGIPG